MPPRKTAGARSEFLAVMGVVAACLSGSETQVHAACFEGPESVGMYADSPVVPEDRLASSDRLTLIGGTFVERLQMDATWEAAIYQNVGGQLVIRNLGWSGDDVHGISRAVFGQPSDGYQRLINDLKLTRPSVVLVAYGANESYEGEAGLERFEAGLNRLLDAIAELPARAVLVTPVPFEDLGAPLPSMMEANTRLEMYCQVLRTLASKRQLQLIDLHREFSTLKAGRWTENGVHLTPEAREKVGRLLATRLAGVDVSDSDWARLKRDEEVQEKVRLKNEWFFHRYRPQNETYLFLFRKHEQGNNAVEIPQFDALVETVEGQVREKLSASKPRENSPD